MSTAELPSATGTAPSEGSAGSAGTGSADAGRPATGSDTKHCDLCGGTDFDLISTRDRKGQPLDTGVCTGCGLVAHMRIPTEAELHRFYTEDYRRDYHGELTPSPRRVMRAWRNGRRIFHQLRPHLMPGQRLLEIGAGIGCTVKVFELEGWRAGGIDPNIGFQSYSRECLHAPVEAGSLYDLPEEPVCDVALLVHVIEHFRSPRSALTHIRKLLPTGGKLYVECPNLATPFATRPRMFHFAHIHNFTPLTLVWLARRCGFRLIERFGGESDPNLQMLFEAGQPSDVDFRGGLEATRATLRRGNRLTYHLRPGYLISRARKVGGYLWEYVDSDRFVRRIEARCRTQSGSPAAAATGFGHPELRRPDAA